MRLPRRTVRTSSVRQCGPDCLSHDEKVLSVSLSSRGPTARSSLENPGGARCCFAVLADWGFERTNTAPLCSVHRARHEGIYPRNNSGAAPRSVHEVRRDSQRTKDAEDQPRSVLASAGAEKRLCEGGTSLSGSWQVGAERSPVAAPRRPSPPPRHAREHAAGAAARRTISKEAGGATARLTESLDDVFFLHPTLLTATPAAAASRRCCSAAAQQRRRQTGGVVCTLGHPPTSVITPRAPPCARGTLETLTAA